MCVGDRFEPLRNYLIEEMERRDWGLVCLARQSGLSHGTISCVLNHERAPTINFFEKIARGLGVPIFDLLALAGYMPPEPPRVKEEKQLLRVFREMGEFERGIVVIVAENIAASVANE